MPRPSATNNEDDIAAATPHYLNLLRPGVRRPAAGVHLRAPLSRQLGGRAAQRRVRHAVHPRIQRLRDLDEAQLRRRRLRVRSGVPRGGGARLRAGDADQRRIGRRSARAWSRAVSIRRRSWSIRTASISKPMLPPLPHERDAISAASGFERRRSRGRFHRHVRRLARHRRAERGDSQASARSRRARGSC